MKLYGGLLSPFVMRAVLAAKVKNVSLDVLSPDIGLKSPEYLALNPMGKMPTLVDGDLVLPESEVIAQYIEDKHPTPPLMPADAAGKARVRLMSRLVDTYMVPHLGGIFNSGKNPEGAAPALLGLAKSFDYIEHYRNAADIHAVGNQFTLADCSMIPMFFFFDAFNASLNTADLVAARPGLASWWARAQSSELTQTACREMGNAFEKFMRSRS
jgi:glutathione S-transferase